MLLIDEQPTVMQRSVSANHIPRFRNRFNEGAVYTLNCFDMVVTGYPTSLFLGGRQRQESGVLMWIDMLLLVKRYAYSFSVAYLFLFLTTHPTLLDEVLHVSSSLQSALLQGSIFAHRLNIGFDVTRGNNYFKFKDSPVAIPFINNTKFVELTVGPPPIPLELFRFHSYEQLQALENTNTEFLGLFLILYSTSYGKSVSSRKPAMTLLTPQTIQRIMANICIDGYISCLRTN
ncbi:hypothetical protein HID58_033891 [Brassica napus]|uniref:Uncharacterized protein n=1 Tax=Brassica napus TaxID=3708 RepID=A0ABQ8C254_BRANA|nr:hypothetical protein HID58_033891 [Brassica napus]